MDFIFATCRINYHAARRFLAGNLEEPLQRNPILVTALNTRIGYEAAAAIAKRAYVEQRPIIDVAAQETGIPRQELAALLDPARLAGLKPG